MGIRPSAEALVEEMMMMTTHPVCLVDICPYISVVGYLQNVLAYVGSSMASPIDTELRPTEVTRHIAHARLEDPKQVQLLCQTSDMPLPNVLLPCM